MDEFVNNVNKLVEKQCWGFIAGKGTGSVVSLDFGMKLPREKPIPNPHLSDEQRMFEGEYSLLISCSWRLDCPDSEICSSKDSNDKNGAMMPGLRNIVNQRIVSVNIVLPAFDLLIHFENELILRVFCDETNVEDEFDNYSFFTPDRTFTVGAKSHLTIE